MNKYHLNQKEHDLATPDGYIREIQFLDDKRAIAIVVIENISPVFVGFQIDPQHVFFNIKSTLAQLGLDGIGEQYAFDPKNHLVEVKVLLLAKGRIAELMLKWLSKGNFIGKLFAADERRRVRDPIYLSRMFGRSDRKAKPLLSLGGLHGSDDLILDKVDGRTIAYLTLQNGRITYAPTIEGFLPTIAKALSENLPLRELLKLHQIWNPDVPRNVEED
ncbi:MAG TPA: hypothetical protein PLC42_02795, partial [Parachlamydiaceae bacterium]|nr:hypothetical protein [Parachlamydiaceae bacterium]